MTDISKEYDVTIKKKIDLFIAKTRIKKKKIMRSLIKREKEKQAVLRENNIIQKKELNDNLKKENELKEEILKLQEQLITKKVVKKAKFPNIKIRVEKTDTTCIFNIIDGNVITNKLPLSIGYYIIDGNPKCKLLNYNISLQYNDFQTKKIIEKLINNYCKSKGIIHYCNIT